MPLHSHVHDRGRSDRLAIRPQFSQSAELEDVPRFRLPHRSMPQNTAYQIIHDELMLDGQARLNLATFVTTWMEPEAVRLMDECFAKNMIDKDEYPQTAEIERRCVSILADLWHADAEAGATGCSTIGSSEACMLGGLAMLWRWRQHRTKAGLATDRANLVLGANSQVCWEKFCRYWDVEARMVPVGDGTTHLTADRAVSHCDERTIGVVAIMGSTYDGTYEPVAEISRGLDDLQTRRGLNVPIHVDAASGGFVAPFIDPEVIWDFQVPRVVSINASGHKYGLVYPGVGWVVWRDPGALPEELIFHVDYLGGDMPTFALNFSRPGAQIVAQYYNFLRLGHDGYRRVQQACRDTAHYLAGSVAEIGPFELISDGSELPVFSFRIRDDISGYTVYDVSDTLRGRGWLLPAYRMPPAIEDVAVLRVVVRNGLSRDIAEMLVADLGHAVTRLGRGQGPPTEGGASSFHH